MTSPVGFQIVTPIDPELFLTPHFRYKEVVCRPNEKARAAGFPAIVDPPPEMVQDYIVPLLLQLEILRAVWGRPMRLDSVFRTVAYNDWLYTSEGETPTHSQHCLGRAGDVVVSGIPPLVVHDTALLMFRNGKLKIGGLGQYRTFTHIDTRPVGAQGHLAQWTGSRAGN